MHRTDGQDHQDNRFVSEDASIGQAATEVTADWLNCLQEELVSLVEAGGLALAKSDNTQVLNAVVKLITSETEKYTAADVLAKLLTVDGAGSGLDADKLDGQQGSYYAVKTTTNNALDLKAPLASPKLSGTPTAPTASNSSNSTQIATTAFVHAVVSALVDSSPAALNTLNELAAALGDDPNFATTVNTQIGLKLAQADVANNLNTTVSGKALDARQGAELEASKLDKTAQAADSAKLNGQSASYYATKSEVDAKLDTADVANNLNTTVSGKALDARQGAALEASKLDKTAQAADSAKLNGQSASYYATKSEVDTKLATADVANNLNTTASGKALDARQGAALEDSKLDKTAQAADSAKLNGQIASYYATKSEVDAKLLKDHIPVGLIAMWSGTQVPSGWTLCNGIAKTDRDGGVYTPPNLSDSFILATTDLSKVKDTGGSSTTSSNGAHTHGLTGMTIGETTLTEDQMPDHNHIVGVRGSTNYGFLYPKQGTYSANGRMKGEGGGATWSGKTGSSGGSQPHTHPISGGSVSNAGAHTHSLTPPYYKLALIAYIGA